MLHFIQTLILLLFSSACLVHSQLYGNGGFGSNSGPIIPSNRRQYGYGGGAGGYGLNPYGVYGGGASGFNGGYKPSYGYQTIYGGGGGLSGYEGPYGGYTNYMQPGISYPPTYVSSTGYYGSSNSYGGGNNYGNGLSNYGAGLGSGNIGGLGSGNLGGLNSGNLGGLGSSNIGGLGSSNIGGIGSGNLGGLGSGNGIAIAGCRDRSSECSLLASTGQCANSANIRSLCPISCGTGCVGNDALVGGGDIYGNGFGDEDYGDTPLYCRDSHIQGCQHWAQLGYCSSVPEFMLSYCKASCGVCNRGNGINGFAPGYSYAGYPSFNGAFPLGSGYSAYLNPFINNNEFNQISSGLPLGGYINSRPDNFPNDPIFLQQLAGSLSGAEQISGFNGGNAFPGIALNNGISPFPYTTYYPLRVNEKREPKRPITTSASLDPQPVGIAAALTSANNGAALSDKMSTVLRMDQIGS